MNDARVAARVIAAGGVLWRRTPEGSYEVALVHRPKYDDWSLPKGKRLLGEAPAVTACREVREETGQDVTLGRPLGRSDYVVESEAGVVAKTVIWWAMAAAGGHFSPGEEVDSIAWLTPDEALARLSPGHDAAPLRLWQSGPPQPDLLLLVRHARAGRRDEWRGSDALRPLDALGRRQAEALAPVLACFRPERIVSAPPLRCLQTIEPLAEVMGLVREVDDGLGETAYWDASGSGVPPLARYAAPTPTVLCSQGGVIPDVLRRMLGAVAAEAPARKGSVWVLSLTPGRLVAADYLPSALYD